MRFGVAVLLALASRAVADSPDPSFDSIYKPSKGEHVPAGKPYTVAWTVPDGAATGTVSIILYGGGSAAKLKPLQTSASK